MKITVFYVKKIEFVGKNSGLEQMKKLLSFVKISPNTAANYGNAPPERISTLFTGPCYIAAPHCRTFFHIIYGCELNVAAIANNGAL